MLRKGKVSAVLIVIVAFIAGIVVMSLTSGDSPTKAGSSFMLALSEMDSEALTELSYAEGVSDEEMLEMWEYTNGVVAPFFTFTYLILSESKPTDDTAIITMDYAKRAGMSGSYDEKYELSLRKIDDKWKVEVFAIDRDMYPGLPR